MFNYDCLQSPQFLQIQKVAHASLAQNDDYKTILHNIMHILKKKNNILMSSLKNMNFLQELFHLLVNAKSKFVLHISFTRCFIMQVF